MNRRELLKGLMAGGVIIAGELWIPGAKVISIPSKKAFYGPSIFEMLDDETVKYVGPANKTASVRSFHQWLWRNMKPALVEGHRGGAAHDKVLLAKGFRLMNPEHLIDGEFMQDASDDHCTLSPMREMWTCKGDMDHADLLIDKIYIQPDTLPRDRISELDNGYVGYR